MSALERNLAYAFKDRELLAEALRHSSYVNEQPGSGPRDNERLEFLGDAVLNLVVGHILMERFPGYNEGDLSRTRAGLVNEGRLAEMARRLAVGDFVQLGRGEAQTGGQDKTSILAGTLEALIAAVYIDGGFAAAATIIQGLFEPSIDGLESAGDRSDCKTRLQELVQARPGARPVYAVIGDEGPDHDKTFFVELRVLDVKATGSGKSKKAAEQDAACNALSLLTA
jgi:ribonuclease-3